MDHENRDNETLDETLRLKVATMMSAENSQDASAVAEWHFVDNSRHRPINITKEEPLVDSTEKMTLHSRRTERLQKKMQKREKKRLHSNIRSFLDLPSELLMAILTYLRPSDLLSLMGVSRSSKEYIETNENILAGDIIAFRYPILAKCFPLPVLLENVDKASHPALLAPRHQQRLVIHKAPYLHVFPSDPTHTCSCMACVLAWNNLCLILDLAHWQKNLDEREPIPMLGRGQRPPWNTNLIHTHAGIVRKALNRPLHHAVILERHLCTTTRTIMRSATLRQKKGRPTILPSSNRLYHLSDSDIVLETDEFLTRSGPPSFEFPFTRDNYYMLLSYLPNRRWVTLEGENQGSWIYYGALHENDLAWANRIYGLEMTLRDAERKHQELLPLMERVLAERRAVEASNPHADTGGA